MTDRRQPTLEALGAAIALRMRIAAMREPFDPDAIVALALDDFAAACVAQHTAEMAPLHAEASAASVKRGYDMAIEKLRQHNRTLYGDAPQYLADWLNADNVRDDALKSK
jgi:hypothetical protein